MKFIEKNTPIATSTRYAQPKTADDVEKAWILATPKTTHSDTLYCLRLWKDWSIFRITHSTELAPTDPSELACNNKELHAFWLEHFMLEVRNKHGNEYSPNGLHHIIVG